MMKTEVAIYAMLYCQCIDLIESCLRTTLNAENFYRIEQGSILIYEDSWRGFAIEPYMDCEGTFYMSGRIRGTLEVAKPLIITIADKLNENSIKYSLDYEEEYNNEPISPEYNISNM